MLDYENFILEALQKAVTSAVGSSIAIKYVNVNMKPPASDKWWEIVYIPNNINNEFWDDCKTFQGILRLILHWPQDNKGAYDAQKEFARVANSFKKGNTYADTLNTINVKIQDHPNATGVIEDSPNLILPLTIRYSCFRIL